MTTVAAMEMTVSAMAVVVLLTALFFLIDIHLMRRESVASIHHEIVIVPKHSRLAGRNGHTTAG